ncbi:MAG: PCRF domain-containing protein [Candidatus Shikimatogenerans bostrichidophilus]|nr:MAG: PCRF domain-containing protein [Candidatus Shikimatogenerans bostrichidophilus]
MVNKIKNIIINIKKIIDINKIKKTKYINDVLIKKILTHNLLKKHIKIYINLNKKRSKFNNIITLYKKIIFYYKDIKLLYSFSNENENFINKEILIYFNKIKNKIKKIKKIIFNKTDSLNALLQINSGAGGYDSSNWVKIIYNMYKNWAIKNNFKLNIINQIILNKNCIKNILIEIIGKYSYGYLKNEDGIHKLIRISPFNKKRHTSFASVSVIPLIKKIDKTIINKKDIKFQTFRSSGAGGQNVNKIESGVRLIHKPSNIYIVCTKTRSQRLNKEYAIKILQSKLELYNKNKINRVNKIKDKIEWGNHTRTYIMHPYKLIKDLKTGYKSKDLDKILNGNIDGIINEYIKLLIFN